MKFDSEKFEDLLNSNIQSYHQKILDKIVKMDSNSYKKLILRQCPISDNEKEITIEKLKYSFDKVIEGRIKFNHIGDMNLIFSDPNLGFGILFPPVSYIGGRRPTHYEVLTEVPIWNFKSINESIDIFWNTNGHLLSYSNLLEMEVYEDVILTYEKRLRLMGHDNFVIKDNWIQFVNSAFEFGFKNFKHVPKHNMGRNIVLFEEETEDNFKLQLSYSNKDLKRKLKENLNLPDYIAVSLKHTMINNDKSSELIIPIGSIDKAYLYNTIPDFEGVLSSLFMISSSDAEFAKKFLVSILEKDGLEYAFYPETLKIWLKKYAIMYYDLLNFTTIDYLTYLKENAVKCLSE